MSVTRGGIFLAFIPNEEESKRDEQWRLHVLEASCIPSVKLLDTQKAHMTFYETYMIGIEAKRQMRL